MSVLSRITRRAPRPDEAAALRAKLLGSGWGLTWRLAVYAILIPPPIFALAIGGIAELFDPGGFWGGVVAGFIVSAMICVAFCILTLRDDLDRRSHFRRHYDKFVLEDIHVILPEVFTLSTYGAVPSPTIVVQLDARQILFLSGPWLLDPQTYGVAPAAVAERAPTFNGLPMPHAFPNTQFTVTRLPDSGEVLAIRVAGVYLDPGPPANVRVGQYSGPASELLSGRWEEAEEIATRFISEQGD